MTKETYGGLNEEFPRLVVFFVLGVLTCVVFCVCWMLVGELLCVVFVELGFWWWFWGVEDCLEGLLAEFGYCFVGLAVCCFF